MLFLLCFNWIKKQTVKASIHAKVGVMCWAFPLPGPAARQTQGSYCSPGQEIVQCIWLVLHELFPSVSSLYTEVSYTKRLLAPATYLAYIHASVFNLLAKQANKLIYKNVELFL